MKKCLLLSILLICCRLSDAFSQVPQAFTYQAVARDNSGNILANQMVALRISILNTNNMGAVIYQERHTPTTNSLGLINLNIGQGVVLSGTFASINWGLNSKYIQIELDPTGGTNYSNMGTTQLLSVPYAMYANQSANAGGGGIANGISSGNTTYWNGSAWVVNSSTLYNNGSEIGIGTTTPDPSAALEIGGTTKGFLMPRMTTIQRDAIPSPALGLQVFNLDDYCIDIYDGSNWIKSCGMKLSGVVTDAQHPAANTWVQKSSLNTSGGRSHAFAFTIGTKAYVGTGNSMSGLLSDFWEYNSENNSWTQKANFPGGPRSEAVAFSIGTKGYVCSGNSGSYVNYDMWEYNPQTDTWTARSNCPGSARTKAQGFAIGAKGYLGLGTDGSTDLNDFWEYDPQTDAWSAKANYPGSGRRYTMGLSVQGKGYIGLGTDANGNYYGDVWEFNPGTNTWLAKNNFPGSGFHSMACFTMNQLGYIGTGYNGTNAMTDFWEYNTSTDTWTTKAIFSGTSRQNAVGFAIGNKGYISTGLFSLMTLTDVWEYMDNNVVGNAYTTAGIGNTNSVSDGAWTIFNNQLYNSNNGNVGIGNSSPTNKLSVTGNADIDGSLGIGLNNPQAQHKLSVLGNSFFNGNVGIGYAFPGNKLSVLGNADFSGNVGIGTSSSSAQLHTTGTVRHEGLSGSGTRNLYVDQNGNLQTITANNNATNNTPQTIGNGGCLETVSTINITGSPTSVQSQNISVVLNINTSSWNTSSLKVYLEAPNGQILNICYSNYTSTNAPGITNIQFTDLAPGTMTISNPNYFDYAYSGNASQIADVPFKPEGNMSNYCSVLGTVSSFSAFGTSGQINPNGTWTLRVFYDYPQGAITLNSWKLNIPTVTNGTNNYFPKWQNNSLSSYSELSETNGKIGIGTNYPSHKLTVIGDIRAFTGSLISSDALRVRNTPSTFDFSIEKDNAAGIRMQMNGNYSMFFATNGTDRMYISNGGAVGIGTNAPTATLSVNGSANKPGGGSWAVFSDRRLKQHILPFNDGLSVINKINPIRFHYNSKSDCDTSKEYVGVLAQELQKVAPYMVSTFSKDEEEYLSVDNSAMTYMLINAVKEQQAQIELLKKEIEVLKQHMDAITR